MIQIFSSIKKDSVTGVSLRILRNVLEEQIFRTFLERPLLLIKIRSCKEKNGTQNNSRSIPSYVLHKKAVPKMFRKSRHFIQSLQKLHSIANAFPGNFLIFSKQLFLKTDLDSRLCNSVAIMKFRQYCIDKCIDKNLVCITH